VVALVLLFYWGSVLWGLLPGRPDISWQGHVFGAIGGVLAAFLASRAGRPAKAAPTPSDSGTGLPGSLTA
jgi:membrane associated rhomboid family serine protease